MSVSPSINVLLAVRQHIDGEIKETREEIAASEAKLEEQRAHLATLLAVRQAAGVQEPTAKSAAPVPVTREQGDPPEPALSLSSDRRDNAQAA
jgi:septal ring factor EnvC (AmiA/AmiB activator)